MINFFWTDGSNALVVPLGRFWKVEAVTLSLRGRAGTPAYAFLNIESPNLDLNVGGFFRVCQLPLFVGAIGPDDGAQILINAGRGLDYRVTGTSDHHVVCPLPDIRVPQKTVIYLSTTPIDPDYPPSWKQMIAVED